MERTPRRGRRLPRERRASVGGVGPGTPAAGEAQGVVVRSCAACRARASRDVLLRFTAVDGQVVFDGDKRLGGRGISVGPSPRCLAEAQKRGAFQRGLKTAVSPEDLAVLTVTVEAALAARLRHWLADAWRRGALVAADADEVPPSVRALWGDARFADIVVGVPIAIPTTPRARRKMAALAYLATQFTLVRGGDKKRRPEPADMCPALAPDPGFALRLRGAAPGEGESGAGTRERNDSSSLAVSAGSGLVPEPIDLDGEHPSGGSE